LSSATDLAVVAALGAARFWYPGAVERMSLARLPVGADGIIPGAEPITLDGTRRAPCVLVLHGFGDTPQSVAPLARALASAGFAVHAPLLAGHGRTLREFARSSGEQWLESARQELAALMARRGPAALVGQSLGGALATILAAEQPELRSLTLLAPYFDAPSYVRAFARAAPVAGAFVPYLVTVDQRSIHDPSARAQSLSFGATTPRLTRELVAIADRARHAFPSVRPPVLYLQSPEDNRVSPAVAERSCASRPGTELVWVPGSGHVLTADAQRDVVAARVTSWIAAR